MRANPLEFLVSSSARQRHALTASTLGWMLDGMDVTLYAMVVRELIRELHLSTAQAGLLASVTLVASAAGGILFGFVADRFGRRPALIASIVVYSCFTAACGFSANLRELALMRLGVGLGMGGEWATGAALVSETWPDEHRGKALGLVQSGFAIGYALAAIIAAVVMPRWGWRPVFFVGILPALLTLWIGRRVEESPLWLAGKTVAETGDLVSKFQVLRPYFKVILITLLMNSAALFGWWGLFTWIPAYLALPIARGGRGFSIAASSAWIVVMQAGMWLGYVTFGFACDVFGRKRTYVLFLFAGALLVPLYSRAQPLALLVLGPLLAFFGTGHFTGFGVITAELFPTSFRASAMGLTYNFGRALSAVAPWLIGIAATRGGLASSFGISGLAFFLAGALALLLPETRGRTLA